MTIQVEGWYPADDDKISDSVHSYDDLEEYRAMEDGLRQNP